MKNFLLRIIFLALLTALGYLAWQNARLHARLESVAVPATNTPPAATGAGTEANSAEARREIEIETSELRGLPFKKPVQYRMMERAKLREFLVGEARKQYTPQELHDYGRTLAAFGLVPEGTDLLEAIVSLYDEQVAAFYVPEERALYTFADQIWTSNVDKMLLSHELTHALQDQHYDLTTLPLKSKTNDDLVLATASLLEGDATVLMTRWYVENIGDGSMLEDLAAMLRQNTEALRAAPAYLREMLLFPYQQGQQFVTALYEAGGLRAVDEAFRHPPTSTHQILHPDKFLRDRHEPQSIEVPAIHASQWRRMGDNVLGEFGVRSLLQQGLSAWQAQVVAQGWDGDRYHAFERGDGGPTGFVWVTAWADEQAAIDFADAYTKLTRDRAASGALHCNVERLATRVIVRQSVDATFLNLKGETIESPAPAK
jgi:hypothetical protein